MRLTLALLSCAMPVMAQDFSLVQPIDCDTGETCYIQNYVDHDPSDDVSDFRCGRLTYDGHKGTDFGLPSIAAMTEGVDVLAAAAGTVRGVRNDMADRIYTSEQAGDIAGRECGNGVVIAHADGWETQYCHLRQGSVTVRSGDLVEAGAVLGQVGLSGRTQFPHVHLSVRRNGRVVDPFDPDGSVTCGAPSADTLWQTLPSTQPGGLLSVGFAQNVPAYDAVKAGTAQAPALASDAPIVLWAFAFGAQPGDILHITFDGPTGPLFDHQEPLTRHQALVMRAAGRAAPPVGWPDGPYQGTVRHLRNGDILDQMTTTTSLP